MRNFAHARTAPRQHVHRGTVNASAFWFDPELLGEQVARRRVMALWAPGMSVLFVAGGYLLRSPRVQRVSTASSPGLPLTLEGGVLTSAPLTASEWGRLGAARDSLVLVRSGHAQVHSLSGARVVDLSSWFDVSAWTVLPTKGLGAPPPPVASAVEPMAPVTRAFFGGSIPEPSREARVVMARMEGRALPPEVVVARRPGLLARLRSAWKRSSAAGPGPRDDVVGARAGMLSRLRALWGASSKVSSGATSGSEGPGIVGRWLGLLAAWLGRASSTAGALPSGDGKGTSTSGARRNALTPRTPSLLSRLWAVFRSRSGTQQAPGSGAGARPTSPRPSGPPPGPGPLSRLSQWLVRNTPLGDLLGRRKAEYLRRLFEMFEGGDLHEALRHAIPLGGNLTANTREALGLPGPREELKLQLGPRGPASTFAGGDALFEALRQRYRAALQRFEREGRIDEAAFILSELLGAHEEAVAFLERHGRFKLAAELAEGRGLPPGLVVRQWFLAKDFRRAIDIARRHNCFADAVLRLERTHPTEANALRLSWGQSRADAGNWAQAVHAIWPVQEARPQAREWLERGAEVGGVSGARLLALWVGSIQGGLEAARPRVLALLDDDSSQGPSERLAFAQALLKEPVSAARAAVLVPTARALLRDRSLGRAHFLFEFIPQLLQGLPDGALRADLPALVPPAQSSWVHDTRRTLLMATASLADAGPFPIHDAVALPGDRLLLALGEAGAVLMSAEGRRLAHFDVPAFSLVASLHGDRVLAVAPRGEVHHVSRVDVVRRRATTWCDVSMNAWAPTYDGEVWFVASRHTVMMLDAQAPEPRALWRVSEVQGLVAWLAASETHVCFVTSDAERWVYELGNGPTLRVRDSFMPRREGVSVLLLSCALTADGEVRASVHFSDREYPRITDADWLWVKPLGSRLATALPADQESLERVRGFLSESWRAELVFVNEVWRVRLFDARDILRARLTFTTDGDEQLPRVQLTSTALLVFDPRGRLLWLDLEHGTVRNGGPA
ncbi:bpX6 domain-containing protein [Myxococcus eversor]|uniref:bpX6 domain-containing protein n=1 Tax=Myxococcus eversor TaxID=2709661 RepID=UPI0013D4C07A|nr:bpX6 domain-containing protein [Myxococcus eversor]